jgi:hypothetical protein
MWGTSQRLGWVFGSAPIVSATTNSLTLAHGMTCTQVEVTNNVLKGTDSRFVDVDKDDYTLQPDSPAIDLGREFPLFPVPVRKNKTPRQPVGCRGDEVSR